MYLGHYVTVAEVGNQCLAQEQELRGSALGTLLREPASHLVQVTGLFTAEVADMRRKQEGAESSCEGQGRETPSPSFAFLYLNILSKLKPSPH